MATVRKRKWRTPAGAVMTGWRVDYKDNSGKRRAKQFARKKDADEFLTKAAWEVSQGTHTADSQSITVAKACDLWLARADREGLEKTTYDAYEQHVRLHIVPFLGARKLNALSKPMIEEYRDGLLDAGRSRAMAKRVLRSLTSAVSEAERKGYVAQNVCRGVTVKRMAREAQKAVIPSKAELRAMIEAAAKRGNDRPIDHPMMMTLAFTGLRASELRALPWRCVDLARNEIRVEQRANFQNTIGPPKTAAGRRTIPIPPMLVTELKKWKLRCPPSPLDLVFPSAAGTPLYHHAQQHGFLDPIQAAAGLMVPAVDAKGKPKLDSEGEPVMTGKYTLHCLRHAAASLWIEQRVDPKRIQRWMGHSSIQVTFDTYGHLFDAVDGEESVTSAVANEVMGAQTA